MVYEGLWVCDRQGHDFPLIYDTVGVCPDRSDSDG